MNDFWMWYVIRNAYFINFVGNGILFIIFVGIRKCNWLGMVNKKCLIFNNLIEFI